MNESFLAIIHDLKNPVSNIKAIHHLLATELKEAASERCHTMLEMLQLSCADAEQLLHRLMEVGVTDSDHFTVQLQAADINQCLKDSMQHYQLMVTRHGLAFELHLSDTSLPALINQECFRRVIGNLLTNAAKFTPISGTVWLSTRRRGDRVQIVLRDTGIGIPSTALPTLFDKFTPATRPGLHGEASYGMGLSLVRRFVTLHYGTIEVESTVGVGTQFTINLPLVTE